MAETNNILEVKNLSIQFGGLRAVDGLNMTIRRGQLYGLIGPNGAGKTTVFNMLTGVYKPTAGTILLDGENITGKPAIAINKAGIARTFQNIRLFKNMSVLDNVKAGLHNHTNYTAIEGALRLPRYFKEEKRITAKALELLKVFELDGEAQQLGSEPPLRQAEKARDSTRARHRPEAAASRRAGSRNEPERDSRAYEHYPLCTRRVQDDDTAHRA